MLIAVVFLVVLAGLLLTWEMWICEGAHLGQRFVVWLYDLAARRYDQIKRFDPDWEQRVLGEPLSGLLANLPDARLLDVGAGTGRTFRAMVDPPGSQLADPENSGTKFAARNPYDFQSGQDRSTQLRVGVEASRHMLRLGKQIVPEEVRWVQSWAVPLPLASESFDAVVCLEVTEFTPNPKKTITEILRVLRPGGWLLISNRVGWQAPLILGRTISRRRFPAFLIGLGFAEVEVLPWQVDYDMAWARKPWI